MGSQPDKRVDELRQQLKSLGYLDAGVDRFVLGSARDTAGPLRLAVQASVRVGVLGGVLLGPTAALGLAARLPGLVTGVRDAVVLALYLAILFVVGVTAAAVVIALALRRRPRIAGWIFTAGCLLYLTLWWQNANAGFGWTAPAWTAFALLVAVGISLLLGHAVQIATLGVLVASGGPGAQPPLPSTSWRVILGGGALAFAGAAVLLIVTASPDARAAVPQRLTVVDSHAPVWLIAIDGFDPATYKRLESSLPNLRAAFAQGAVALRPQDTSDPARAWTTIGTGVPPEVHGVHAIETRRVAGLRGAVARDGRFGRLIVAASDLVRLTQPAVVTSDQRQARTIWEVAEDAGLRTAVINWWATWPAPSSAGIVVSDRAVLRLERGGTLDAEIAPAELYESLRAQWPAIHARASASALTAFPDGSDATTLAILRRSAELDAGIAAIAESLPSGQLDLLVVYFPGLDIAQNALLGSDRGAMTTSALAARVDALRAYYQLLDRVLAPLVSSREDHQIMIVTQPGRVQAPAEGLFVSAYNRTNGSGHLRSPLDVAPTVLAALGLPLSRELAGQPIPLPWSTSYRYVESYGKAFAESASRSGKPLDQETIDRLRSLGYIK